LLQPTFLQEKNYYYHRRPTIQKIIMLTRIKQKTVSFLKHSSYFLNMSQSPPKDFSYTGLLFHSPSRGSQVTTLALLANASAIAQPSLSHWSKRDVRAIQWSNDVLSTLLDLYEEKYLTFDRGSFRIKDWENIWKKLVTHIST